MIRQAYQLHDVALGQHYHPPADADPLPHCSANGVNIVSGNWRAGFVNIHLSVGYVGKEVLLYLVDQRGQLRCVLALYGSVADVAVQLNEQILVLNAKSVYGCRAVDSSDGVPRSVYS